MRAFVSAPRALRGFTVANLVGTVVDKYEMLEEVGHGGMAVVYRGRDNVLQREVAVKVLHSHLASREESQQRLRREALAVAKLRHDNILEIYDYAAKDESESYIVTEFIHGPTLKEWLDAHDHQRPALAAMIIHRLCQALGHAHQSGIIHRDIKPENVMIRAADGCVKLMDFGIAQLLDTQKLTMTGQLLGSPAYMAPELVSGRPLDVRTDLFSMGVLLYQLSTGALPFTGRNPHEVLNRIADGEFVLPSAVNPLVDAELEAIIRTALRVNPDERYQRADALAAELAGYLDEMDLQPTNQELARYFRDPDEYVRELDERVVAALMHRAEQAIRDGFHARAIRQLGRVLELEPGHRAARTALGRLKQRERRTRQLLFTGAVLAVGGLVGAGFVLWQPEPSPEHLPPAPVAQAPAPLAVVPPQPTADRDVADGGNAKNAQSQSRDDVRSVAVRERPPARAAGPTRCTVKLEGVPAAAARHLTITWGNHEERVSGLQHHIAFSEPKVRVQVLSGRYGGSTWITQEACARGPVVVRALTKPAQVIFTNAPEGLVVKCVSGCPQSLRDIDFDPASFPVIPMDGPSMQVQLAYRHADYQPLKRWERLSPGPNPITLDLRRR